MRLTAPGQDARLVSLDLGLCLLRILDTSWECHPHITYLVKAMASSQTDLGLFF